ncbi:MAG TPA: hypothetical protein VFP34_00885 [Microlunatus sp.]|nr:hypothetical protein [Microlunatus sp.]
MSIHIDWQSLVVVAIVSVLGTVVFVTLLSAGIRSMSLAIVRTDQHQPAMTARIAGWSLLGLAALSVLFGLYLIVPFFH